MKTRYRPWPGITLVLCVACGAQPAEPPTPQAGTLRPTANASVHQEPAPKASRCDLGPVVHKARTQAAPPENVTCRAQSAQNLDWVEAQLRKRYPRKSQSSRTIVDFRCDPIGSIRRALLVFGEGHAQGLTVVGMSVPPGTEGDVVIRTSEYRRARETYTDYSYAYADRYEASFGQATLPLSTVGPLLARARTSLLGTIHLVEVESNVMGWSDTFTSASWFRSVELYDANSGKLATSIFRVPVGEDGLSDAIARELALETLSPLVPAQSVPISPTAEHVSDVLDAFAVVRTGWAKTPLLGIAAHTRSAAMIAHVLAELRQSNVNHPDRVDAVGALAKLTGWDARYAEDGAPRSIDDVSQDYLNECSKLHAGY